MSAKSFSSSRIRLNRSCCTSAGSLHSARIRTSIVSKDGVLTQSICVAHSVHFMYKDLEAGCWIQLMYLEDSSRHSSYTDISSGYRRGQRAGFALTFLLDPCYHLGWPDGSPSAAGHPLSSEVSHTCASITNKQAPTDCRSRFSRCSTSYLPPGRSQNSKSKKTL